MADIAATSWDEVDSDNDAAAPEGAPEGMAPSGINNVLRAHQGAIKRWYNQTIPVTTTGTASTFVAAYSVTPTALEDGMTHLVTFHAANAASATLDINALGAKPLHVLKPAGWGVVPASTVVADMVCRVTYHETSGAYRIIEGPTSAVISGSEGYTVGPSGTRRQWGQSIVGVGAGGAAITFQVAFSAIYTVQVTANGNSGTPTAYISVGSASTTGFTLVNNGFSNINFLWFAEGAA